MRVVVAPGGVPGVSSVAAAGLLVEGWARVRRHDTLSTVPLPDPRTPALEAVAAAAPGCRRRAAVVADARGRAAEASWLRLADGGALVDATVVAAPGGSGGADLELTTTYGVGQLVAAAADGARRVVVALAGPPQRPPVALDAGAGLAVALGHRLLRRDGNGVKIGGAHLGELARIVPAAAAPPPVVAAVDGSSPLLGPRGAVPGAARACGVDARGLWRLEEAFAVLVAVVLRDLRRDLAGAPGAGACGGLGFGLAAFAGAALEDRLDALADLAGLDVAIGGSDAVLTAGTAAPRVARRAAAAGVATLDATPGHHDPGPDLERRASALAARQGSRDAGRGHGRRTPRR